MYRRLSDIQTAKANEYRGDVDRVVKITRDDDGEETRSDYT